MAMDDDEPTKSEARAQSLWKLLGGEQDGQLNLPKLRQGLKDLDHPLQNADSILQNVLTRIGKQQDGQVRFEEFRGFVQHTEKHLWDLFVSIDRKHNGRLDRNELRTAFNTAGLDIASTKVDDFFAQVDRNHDGVITFDEWRNFLLFIPSDSPNLRTVLSYVSSVVKVNAEGDVHVADDGGQGLGIETFIVAFFGPLSRLFQPSPANKGNIPSFTTQGSNSAKKFPSTINKDTSKAETFPWDPGEEVIQTGDLDATVPVHHEHHKLENVERLTDLFPDPGYFVAGAIAGAVSRTATAPLDRLKVYLIAQTSVKADAMSAVKSGAPLQAAKTASRPLGDAVRALWQMGGVQSLFAGNGLNVLKIMPESAIKFGSYEGSRRIFASYEGHEDPKNLAPWSQFFAAGIGGMISQFCIYPLDTLKFRMQTETVKGGLHGNALILATARKMWTHGPRTFYRGLPMGLAGMFPYSAIDLTTFEYLKQFLNSQKAKRIRCNPDDPRAAIGNFTTAAIGAFSGAIGASVVYPLNLLRTRLQCQGTAIHPPVYTGIWDVTSKTVQREGVRGLFRGITPNLLKVVPAVSITYVVYDNSKKVLGLR